MVYRDTFPVFEGFSNLHYGISKRWHGDMNRNSLYGRMHCLEYFEKYVRKNSSIGMVYAPRLEHGKNVIIVTSEISIEEDVVADGCVTNVPGVCMAVPAADCPPIYVFDPMVQIGGIAHSGWRGTAMNIAGSMVAACMSMGSVPKNIRAAIGPGIGQCCYVVGEDVAGTFQKHGYGKRLMIISTESGSTYYLSLEGVIYDELRSAGLRDEHINTSGACTFCCNKVLYSRRRDGADLPMSMLAYIYTE